MTPMQVMAHHAAQAKLALQCCTDCGTVQYPPRELCSKCLSDRLDWQIAAQQCGEVLAVTTLHHSHDAAFRDRLPLQVALVRLDLGPTAVCFLGGACRSGDRVNVTARADAANRAVLTATSQ